MQYMYPDNLKSKAILWLWELKDIGIIGISVVVSIFALAQTQIYLPIVFTSVYAFVSIRFNDISILDFIKYAVSFFIAKPQRYDWRI